MKRIASALVTLATLLVGARAASAAPKDPNAALRRFAFVASSNDGGPGRVPLRFATSDAQAMADVLAHLGGLRAEDLVSVTGVKRATFQSSLDRLRTIMSQTPKGVRRELVVYYSGHSDENGLLLGGERLSYRELRQWLDAMDAEVRIAILDSCASGSLIRLRGGTHRQPFLADLSTDTRGHAFSRQAPRTRPRRSRIASALPSSLTIWSPA
jgi:Caspase domain